jgi:hypothetical protein
MAGLLARTSLWEFLGGFNLDLPAELQGVDFGWRANLAGAKVIVEPDAEVVDNSLVDLADERAGTLALASVHSKGAFRPFRAIALTLWTILLALGFLIGKDFWRAAAELRGWWRWIRRRNLRKSLRRQLQTLPATPDTVKATNILRPTALDGLKYSAHLAFSRIADWIRSFAGRGSASGSMSFDEMTGDDYSLITSTARKWSVLATGVLLSVVGTLIAARSQYGMGALRGAWLLPAPDSFTDLIARHLASVPTDVTSASPPWVGLTGLLSLITLGNPDWLITIILVGCVPLTWLAAYRFARTLSANALVAAFAAAGYALIPALSGVLNAGGFTVVLWGMLLPAAAYSWHWWHQVAPNSWRGAGMLALWLTLMVALAPIAWPLSLVAAIVFIARKRTVRGAFQWLLIEAAPALALFGPWGKTLAHFPGRLLTGASPILHSQEPLDAWRVLFLAYDNPRLPPLWLQLTVMGVLWLVALLAAIRRRSATIGLFIASALAIIAIGLTRLSVAVSPGVIVRPDGIELAIAGTGALLVTAVIGFQGISGDLRGNAVGLRHMGALLVSGISVASLILAASWWVWDGQSGVSRDVLGKLPTYVANTLGAEKDARVLALQTGGDGPGAELRWSLLRGGYTTLGDEETDLWFSGSIPAADSAKSVVYRLAAAAEDDALVEDLQQLGVAYIWLAGGSSELISGIGNTPGLGVATIAGTNAVWTVPDAQPLATPLYEQDKWWAFAQIGGLLLLVLLALPQVRARAGVSRPKRSHGGGR